MKFLYNLVDGVWQDATVRPAEAKLQHVWQATSESFVDHMDVAPTDQETLLQRGDRAGRGEIDRLGASDFWRS